MFIEEFFIVKLGAEEGDFHKRIINGTIYYVQNKKSLIKIIRFSGATAQSGGTTSKQNKRARSFDRALLYSKFYILAINYHKPHKHLDYPMSTSYPHDSDRSPVDIECSVGFQQLQFEPWLLLQVLRFQLLLHLQHQQLL